MARDKKQQQTPKDAATGRQHSRRRRDDGCLCRFIRSPHVRSLFRRIAYREALLAGAILPDDDLPRIPEEWVQGIPLNNTQIHLIEDELACVRLTALMDQAAELALAGLTWTLVPGPAHPLKEDARSDGTGPFPA